MMEITRVSMFSGKEHTMELDITEDQLRMIAMGGLVQNVCPHLNADEREFLISGASPWEWDEIMGSDEDEYEDLYDGGDREFPNGGEDA